MHTKTAPPPPRCRAIEIGKQLMKSVRNHWCKYLMDMGFTETSLDPQIVGFLLNKDPKEVPLV